MNCQEANWILDARVPEELGLEEKRNIELHFASCPTCRDAWAAFREIAADQIPGTPQHLRLRIATALARRVSAIATGVRVSPQRRSSRGPLIVAGALVTGMALAAVTVISLSERTPASVATTFTARPSSSPPTNAAASAPATAPPTSHDGITSVELVETDLNIVPVVRHAPEYPAEALTRGLQGSVTLRFDVTATGAVENASVVESTQPELDAAALRALSRWKYLPRIAAGRRVATANQRTVIRFQLASTAPATNQRTTPRDDDSHRADFPTFAAAVEVAWERLAADDLRGAELQLDEQRATYELDGLQEGSVWSFYAYLYTVQGNYDRAIDAYETALAAYARAGTPWQGSWLPLANLYYARHQYDMALRTLLTYKMHVSNSPGWPLATGTDDFIERLRTLGVTEETLPLQR